MSDQIDAVARLGLALYRETIANGANHYSVEQLMYGFNEVEQSGGVLRNLFRKAPFDFWGQQEDLSRRLAQSGFAEHFSKAQDGPFRRGHYLKLTPLGRRVYDLASAQSDPSQPDIEGLSIEDAVGVLKDERLAEELSKELEALDSEFDKLGLTNFQRATVSSYVSMMVVVCRMPDPDAKLFWVILNRLSQFAGVASLIVALIALKLGRAI